MAGSGLLRRRDEEGSGRVSYAELFFDLVFVFTIIQLSHALAHHFTPVGLFESAVLVLAIWWVWMFTTWALNWLDPRAMAVRLMLFALMFAGMLLSTAMPGAWTDSGPAFAITYTVMQVGRSVFTAWCFRNETNGNGERNFLRIAFWLSCSGVFWIAGGFASHEMRLVLWPIALLIEYASPAAYFWTPGLGRSSTADWDISGAHMAERCALFVIICLGETILVNGRTFSDITVTPQTAIAFASAFVTTCMLWWVYFRFGHDRASHLIEESNDPGRLGRAVFTYAHIPIVAGVIVTAVGGQFMLDHPSGHSNLPEAVAILGGPALFLLGNIWFKRSAFGRAPLSHIAGLVLLAGVAPFHAALEPFLLGVAAAAILVLVAVWEFRSIGEPRHSAA